MTNENFNYFLGITLFLLPVLYIVNILWFKRWGQTLLGEKYEKGTVEYDRLVKAGSIKSLSIAGFFVLITGINLITTANKVLDSEASDSKVIIVIAPILVIFLFAILSYTAYKMFNSTPKK